MASLAPVGLKTWHRPTITDPGALMFGRAPFPLRCGLDLEVGAGEVYPEINFTLPPMLIDSGTWSQIVDIYDRVMQDLLARARELALTGLVVEFEHLPPMTANPPWGAELTAHIKAQLVRAHGAWGLRSALRVTIVDLRDELRPPRRRSGPAWEHMRAALNQCAAAGADVLSVESTGGKEVHDAALPRGDVAGIALTLGVLAPADMRWLWRQIVSVAAQHGVVAGGDSACGFANTAMQLAGQHMLPDCLAALVRAISAARSLVAFESGARGPGKDCAYENPVLKAITGYAISMEGRSATCAHFSPLGNVAAAAADLWSNESVPDVRLLSGPAPVASLESLAYDCRLMNAALRRGTERELRDLHVASDAPLSGQAALLTPEASIAIAQAITTESDPYRRTIAAGRVALDWLLRLETANQLPTNATEVRWIDRLRGELDRLPEDPMQLRNAVNARYGALYDPAEYELES